jgi:hypothetical protein
MIMASLVGGTVGTLEAVDEVEDADDDGEASLSNAVVGVTSSELTVDETDKAPVGSAVTISLVATSVGSADAVVVGSVLLDGDELEASSVEVAVGSSDDGSVADTSPVWAWLGETVAMAVGSAEVSPASVEDASTAVVSVAEPSDEVPAVGTSLAEVSVGAGSSVETPVVNPSVAETSVFAGGSVVNVGSSVAETSVLAGGAVLNDGSSVAVDETSVAVA